MIPERGKPLTDSQGQSGLCTRLMIFDCRGFEPVDFSFGDGWMAESVYIPNLSFQICLILLLVCDCNYLVLFSQKSGEATFEVDLSEGEFADYDEKSECPVGVSNLKSVFKVVRLLVNCIRHYPVPSMDKPVLNGYKFRHNPTLFSRIISVFF